MTGSASPVSRPRSSVIMINFYYIARGSVTETQSHIEYGRRVGYLTFGTSDALSKQLSTVLADLNKVIATLRKSSK
jgi:four helix bundle protein